MPKLSNIAKTVKNRPILEAMCLIRDTGITFLIEFGLKHPNFAYYNPWKSQSDAR